jgi:hypothetical protein
VLDSTGLSGSILAVRKHLFLEREAKRRHLTRLKQPFNTVGSKPRHFSKIIGWRRAKKGVCLVLYRRKVFLFDYPHDESAGIDCWLPTAAGWLGDAGHYEFGAIRVTLSNAMNLRTGMEEGGLVEGEDTP